MSDLRETLEKEVFPFVEKPMRYIGNELHCIKKDLSTVSLHGVLCFPELYDLGMSHYGSQILYHIVNKHPGWALSRCYAPWHDAEKILREKHLPLYSLEYFMPLKEVDWLGFSIQYELQYTNVITMLDLAGIPLLAKERTDTDPIVLAGGSCMGNCEPLADFFDACVIGDGEQIIREVCTVLQQYRSRRAGRSETMLRLGELGGVYVPALYTVAEKGLFLVPELSGGTQPVRASKVSSLDDEDYPSAPLVPVVDVVHHRLAVEVMRGCTRSCRFCAAGFYYRPVRERRVSSVVTQVTDGTGSTGWEEVGLLSLSTADYSQFNSLIHALAQIKQTLPLRISLPSTRVDALAESELHILRTALSATSFTIAPEAGSQRLRNVINKDFTRETIFKTVELLLAHNIQTIKLYFMIGLPTETDEDIEAIIDLVGAIADMVRAKSKRRMVHVSVSPFSPKAHTPFQWESMDGIVNLNKKGRTIKAALRNRKNVKVSYRNPEMTFLETVLARGDRRLAAVISRAWEMGARFDGWDERFDLLRWRKAAAETGVALEPYAGEIPEAQALPWSVISLGITSEFFSAELRNARDAQTIEDCRKSVCTQCGVCTPEQVRRRKNTVADSVFDYVPAIKETESAERKDRYRYRVVYEKGYNTRFLSHQNIVNCIQRALRMERVPVAYSQGYHPHPSMAFGPPLALGVMGTNELFDIVTTTSCTFDMERINTHLPEDLVLKKAAVISGKPTAISAAIVAAQYSIRPLQPMSKEDLHRAIERIERRTSLLITIEKKGKTVTRDLKPLVFNLTVPERNGTLGIAALVSARPSGNCRPRDLVRSLFPEYRESDFLVTRTACLADVDGVLTIMSAGA